jgi:prepilin-type N-terminal cleavage/methylation domain-containing protein
MITISPATNSVRKRRGFTLPEVLIASTLTVVVMGGILSTSLMITRSGYRVEQYTDMENESRKSLEQFGQDVRMAQAVEWHNANSLTLTIPNDSTSEHTHTCTYTYDAAARTLSRSEGGMTKVLISGIDECTVMGYKISGIETHTSSTPPIPWATISNSTKQLQLSVSSRRTQSTQVQTGQKVISARFILRNKRVT